jgi:hypothetical protein
VRVALFLLALTATAALATTEADLIRAGRRVSVHAIDSTLAPRRLDDWIKQLAGKGAHIAWEANDCGEATGNPADSARVLPVCVEASARCADGREIRVAIAVGSDGRLTDDPPGLWWAMIDSAGLSQDYPSLGALARAMKTRRP